MMRRALLLLALLFGFEVRAEPILVVGAAGDIGRIDKGAIARLGSVPAPVRAIASGSETIYVLGADRVIRHPLTAPSATKATPIEGKGVDLALSGDGRFLLIATTHPPRLSFRDSATLDEVHALPIRVEGGRVSAPQAVHTMAARGSFLVALTDIAEAWEIPYGDNPAYRGWVHDFRDDGPPAQVPRFPLRRMVLKEPLIDFAVPDQGDHLFAYAPQSATIQALDLYIGRVFARDSIGGRHAPRHGLRMGQGREAMLIVPGIDRAELVLFAFDDGRRIGAIPLGAPAPLLIHGAGNRLYAASGDGIEAIDPFRRQELARAKPRPGRRPAAMAWDGDAVLVAYTESDEILLLDPRDLRETGRLSFPRPIALHDPMNRPGMAARAAN
ncbi:MAG: hypothetical protein FJX47_01050 [Alphaproteobacteria bacterium]|nr:hypothetical protein [Alphaproteobacteria bacterium]